ncbi:MAG: hypothetical protein ABR613_00870 [Actinomycetota bacterium]
MISAAMAVALALAAASPSGGEPRGLERHVCLLHHDCAPEPVLCLTAALGECASPAQVCLPGPCTLGPVGAPSPREPLS